MRSAAVWSLLTACLLVSASCVSPRDDCLGRGGETAYSEAEAWCQKGAAVIAMGPLYGDTSPVGDGVALFIAYECWRADQERQKCEREPNTPLRPDL